MAGNGVGGNPWCDEYYWDAAGSQLVNGSITYKDVPAGVYEFKITDGSWHEAGGTEWAFSALNTACSSDNVLEGSNGNIKLVTTKTQDITIAFDGTNICVTGEFSSGVEISSYTIVGEYALMGDSWNSTAPENDMTETSPGVFTLVKSNRSLLATSYGYKVVGNHSYSVFEYPASGNNLITIPADGNYDVTFTFTPASNTLTAEAVQSTSTGMEKIYKGQCAHILIRDGQIFIIRGDKTYTITGQEVK